MIHIDCWTDRLDWSQYDLSKDEVYVVDNLFPGWFIHHVHDTILKILMQCLQLIELKDSQFRETHF